MFLVITVGRVVTVASLMAGRGALLLPEDVNVVEFELRAQQ